MAGIFIGFSEKDNFIEGFGKFGFSRLLLELDEDGFPIRELGLDEDDKAVHKYSDTENRLDSLFFISPFADVKGYESSSFSIDPSEFERLWNSSNT